MAVAGDARPGTVTSRMAGFIFTASEDLAWLRHAACADREVKDYFVEAGHVIDEDVLNLCRACPVRESCIRHAYKQEVTGGYFGGLSPGQRRDLSLDEALAYAEEDTVEKRRARLNADLSDFDDEEILYS